MHEAEKYLKENKPGHLYVRYRGEKRRLFITESNYIGMISKRRRHYGYPFSDWEGIDKVYFPDSETDRNRKVVKKYITEASKATFINDFIRHCLQADTEKSPYQNGISTGNRIDGKIISLASIAKTSPNDAKMFEEAMKKRIQFSSPRFRFRGYDGSFEVTVNKRGEATGYFSMEYQGCGNGYYYLLINDQNFIGYDID